MAKAIGMVECTTVSAGFKAADDMAKAANVELLQAEATCPGKFVILIAGELSAVRASVDRAEIAYADRVIDTFVLGNPHESIFPAIYGTAEPDSIEALGVLETYDVAAMIVAADVAAKTALVELLELRLAKGMCGKSYMTITGSVSAVQAAIDAAKISAGDKGMFLDESVIARPSDQLMRFL
ncbi:MAG: BMC domain-containing protein [Lachnospiraceae bacterium]|nr:BMC domain-containing protein [Lachnospiraceae bacterium]MCR5410919.1 BMC domain-containing protein [Lachnospiraceae bacterium]